MIDKVHKIREKVARIQLYTQSEVLKDILDYIDEVQKEPISEDLNTELNKYIKDHFTIDTEQLDRFGIEEKDYMYSMDKSDMLALVEHFTNWQKTKEEPVSEDFNAMCLDENGNPTLAKETDFTRGFVKGAQWQKRKDSASVSEELEEASKEWLIPQLDKSYANYGEGKMMELTHFDGYAMLDAIEFGAKWQREKDESTTEDLGEYINELSKQFPEVSFAKISRIAVRVAKWQKLKDMGITNNAKGVVTNILNSSDKSLDIYATEVAFIMLPANLTENYHMTNRGRISDAVRLGAKWQKANLWKPADGDDLPEYEREVVAFQEIFPTDVDVPSLLKIVIAHRPNPEGYDGKSIATGKVEHHTPQTYDKGGWNIPDVKWWLDCLIPNMEK